MLSQAERRAFEATGHVTIEPFLSDEELAAVRACIEQWMEEYVQKVAPEDEGWYFEKQPGMASPQLRKLDQPVFYKEEFRELAGSKRLLGVVEGLIGKGVTVFFSQVFCKSPEVGGPKPAHQDNFYFGPADANDTLTVWLAIDDATTQNGCLYFVDGTHKEAVVPHEAPADEPFNLQIDGEACAARSWTAAPVKAGGLSIHHGNTWHRSAANQSEAARRAVAIHYLKNDAELTKPALPYDLSFAVRVSE